MTRRLLASYLVITVLVLAVLEVPLALSYARRQVDDLTSQIERDAFALASFAEDSLESGEPSSLLLSTAVEYGRGTGARVVVVDASGMAVVDTDPPSPGPRSFATRPEIQIALAGDVAPGKRSSQTLGADLVYVAVPVASGGQVHGAVRVSYEGSALNTRIQRYVMTLLAIAVVSLAGVATAALVIARWVTRPLHRLRATATALGRGALDERAEEDAGPPEVRALAAELNRTAGLLARLIEAQDAFVADASHQLRTPLAALRLRLENLQDELGPEAGPDLDGAMAEVLRLSRLVDGLLMLARNAPPAGLDAVDLGECLAERCAAWEPLATERAARLELDADWRPIVAAARADHVAQVVDNLMANALEASPRGSTIVLRATKSGNTVQLHVVDQGAGLAAEERRRAFDRFWRAGSRQSRLSGSGLGLAIVAKLVAADGGDARLEPAEPHGVDAVVSYRAGRPTYTSVAAGGSEQA